MQVLKPENLKNKELENVKTIPAFDNDNEWAGIDVQTSLLDYINILKEGGSIGGSVTVEGKIDVQGDAKIGGDTEIFGDLTSYSNIDLSGLITTDISEQKTTIKGLDLEVDAKASFNNDAEFKGYVELGNNVHAETAPQGDKNVTRVANLDYVNEKAKDYATLAYLHENYVDNGTFSDTLEDYATKEGVTETLEDYVDKTYLEENYTDNEGLDTLKKGLEGQIKNISGIGRFLSGWDCTTGLATTNPQQSPYEYPNGSYFIIARVAKDGGTNYKPDGSSYTIGEASTTVEDLSVNVGDIYKFDNTTWQLIDLDNIDIADFAQDVAGVIRGSDKDGYVESEDGYGKVHGWDNVVKNTDFATDEKAGIVKTGENIKNEDGTISVPTIKTSSSTSSKPEDSSYIPGLVKSIHGQYPEVKIETLDDLDNANLKDDSFRGNIQAYAETGFLYTKVLKLKSGSDIQIACLASMLQNLDVVYVLNGVYNGGFKDSGSDSGLTIQLIYHGLLICKGGYFQMFDSDTGKHYFSSQIESSTPISWTEIDGTKVPAVLYSSKEPTDGTKISSSDLIVPTGYVVKVGDSVLTPTSLYEITALPIRGLIDQNYTVKITGNVGSGASITVDTSLSSTSTNPVQNKVINTALGNKVETGYTSSGGNIPVEKDTSNRGYVKAVLQNPNFDVLSSDVLNSLLSDTSNNKKRLVIRTHTNANGGWNVPMSFARNSTSDPIQGVHVFSTKNYETYIHQRGYAQSNGKATTFTSLNIVHSSSGLQLTGSYGTIATDGTTTSNESINVTLKSGGTGNSVLTDNGKYMVLSTYLNNYLSSYMPKGGGYFDGEIAGPSYGSDPVIYHVSGNTIYDVAESIRSGSSSFESTLYLPLRDLVTLPKQYTLYASGISLGYLWATEGQVFTTTSRDIEITMAPYFITSGMHLGNPKQNGYPNPSQTSWYNSFYVIFNLSASSSLSLTIIGLKDGPITKTFSKSSGVLMAHVFVCNYNETQIAHVSGTYIQ